MVHSLGIIYCHLKGIVCLHLHLLHKLILESVPQCTLCLAKITFAIFLQPRVYRLNGISHAEIVIGIA